MNWTAPATFEPKPCGELLLVSRELQAELVALAKQAGQLVVELDRPGPAERGRLGLFIEDAIEQVLMACGATPPGVGASSNLDASLSDQLFRARLVHKSGLVLAFDRLEGITNLAGALDAQDSAVLRWWMRTTAERPVRLFLDENDRYLGVYAAPTTLHALVERGPAWTPPDPEFAHPSAETPVASPELAASASVMQLAPAPAPITLESEPPPPPSSEGPTFAEPEPPTEPDAELLLSAEPRAPEYDTGPEPADIIVQAAHHDELGGAAEHEPSEAEAAHDEPPDAEITSDAAPYHADEDVLSALAPAPAPQGSDADGTGSLEALSEEFPEQAPEYGAEAEDVRDTELPTVDPSPSAPVVLAEASDEPEPGFEPIVLEPLVPASRSRVIEESDLGSAFKAVLLDAENDEPSDVLVAKELEPLVLPEPLVATPVIAIQADLLPECQPEPASSLDESLEADSQERPRSFERRPKVRHDAAAAAPAPAPAAEARKPRAAKIVSSEERAGWIRELEGARGPKPLAVIERLFVSSYVPLREALTLGLEDSRAQAAADTWSASFDKSYRDAFDALRLRGKRPTMVLDVPDLALRIGRLHGARSTQLVLVDGMRFDLGLRVQQRMGEILGQQAALTERLLLWSALPSTTATQLEWIARGPAGLKDISPPTEVELPVARGRAAQTLRRVKAGSRELMKLDLIEARLNEPGTGVAERLDQLANETAEILATYLVRLPPRTLVMMFGDHGFTMETTDAGTAARQGGASPEEILVPAFAWIVGPVH